MRNYKIFYFNEKMLVAEGVCGLSGSNYKTKPFSKEGFEEWQNGKFIQVALHELNEDDREFLISGVSPKGWAIMED